MKQFDYEESHEKYIDDDQLYILFDLQRKFQAKLNNNVLTQEFRRDMILAAIDELTEALRETPWKPWKKQQQYNKENFRKEIIDLWHFVINLSLAAEFTSQELFDEFNKKHQINNERQKNKY